MKKLTILVLHLHYGGAEKQIVTMANALSDIYEIEIVSIYKISTEPFYKLSDKIKVTYLLPYGPNRDAFQQARRCGSLLKIIKEGLLALKILFLKKYLMTKAMKQLNCDVIISSRIEFVEWLKNNNPRKIPVITQEHSFFENGKYIARMQRAFKHCEALVVMSSTALEKHQLWLKDLDVQVVKIANMIEPVETTMLPKYERKQILSVGRMHEIKRFDLMIELFQTVIQEDSDWNLCLIGDGEQLKYLMQKVESAKLQHRVHFTGALTQEEITTYYLNSSIFLLTSASESFSLVLAEAQATGLPTIAFDVEVGPRDIIINNETGYLVTEGNHKAFVESLSTLMNDVDLRKNMGLQGRERSKQFYKTEIRKAWVALVENITLK